MPSSLRRLLTVTATAAAVSLGTAACSQSSLISDEPGHGSSAQESAAATGAGHAATATATGGETVNGTLASGAGDTMFARMMIPHHEQAVEMADLALAKTDASAQVRQLATTIKAAQAPEIATMKGWLAEWGVPATAAPPAETEHAAGMMSEASMQALRAASGTAFDSRWLTMMIDHHQGAVTMAKDVLATSADEKVRALATSIESSQTAEIATMRTMLGSASATASPTATPTP